MTFVFLEYMYGCPFNFAVSKQEKTVSVGATNKGTLLVVASFLPQGTTVPLWNSYWLYPWKFTMNLSPLFCLLSVFWSFEIFPYFVSEIFAFKKNQRAGNVHKTWYDAKTPLVDLRVLA